MQAGDNTKACQTDSLPDALVGSAASKSDHVCQDDVDMTRKKLESLRDHVRQFAGSLLTAIDQDTDPEFTLVSNNKRRGHPSRRNQQPATSMPQRTTSTSRQRPSLASGAQAQHPSLQGTQVDPRRQPDEHGTQSRSSGQRIPVVQLGATNAARKTTPPTYSHVLHHGQRTNGPTHPATGPMRARPSADTVIIGTSLTRGLGSKLHKCGVDAVTYSYPGTRIEHIRSRIPHILSGDRQPKQVVLQCGGNDAETETADCVMRNYDSLINDVRHCCPNASIVVCTVPPRGEKRDVMDNIDTLNTYLDQRATCGDNVWCIDVCHKSLKMYRKDKVHFNNEGLKFYARALARQLSNFSWSHHRRNV